MRTLILTITALVFLALVFTFAFQLGQFLATDTIIHTTCILDAVSVTATPNN